MERNALAGNVQAHAMHPHIAEGVALLTCVMHACGVCLLGQAAGDHGCGPRTRDQDQGGEEGREGKSQGGGRGSSSSREGQGSKSSSVSLRPPRIAAQCTPA